MRCNHCNTEMILDNSVVFTIYPAQNQYKCPKCGYIDFSKAVTTPKDYAPIYYQTVTEEQVRADERKKVVEKIREKFKENLIDWYEDEDNANKELYLDADELWRTLDQVEKGESNVKN